MQHFVRLCNRFVRPMPLVLTVCATMYFSCGQRQLSPGPPQNLRCEYQANPIGIDERQPRLYWQIEDDRRGAVQTAYQVLVASSAEALQKDQGDVWDSGKVESDQSVHVPYAGAMLTSRTRYFWKVRTWDLQGNPSPYSETAFWEMGLLNPTDWQAQWIGKIEQKEKAAVWPWGKWIWHPSERGIDKTVYFRTEFTLPPNKKVKKATARITADNKFTLFLNETELGSGSRWQTIFNFSCDSLLRAGTNTIAISAANLAGDICGLLFSLKVEFEDGSTRLINSGENWTTSATEVAGWKKPGTSGGRWIKARVIEEFGGPIWGKVDEIHVPPRSVMVRKEFTIEKPLERARAYVTGLGAYILHVNGQRVGKDILTPGWTAYAKRLQYQTYDVTPLLKTGQNAVAGLLGNAWWSGGLGSNGNIVYQDGPLKLLLQLVIDYQDGSVETIVTDKTWTCHDAPILYNSLYHGEIYDARLEQPGWDKAGFNTENWQPVSIFEPEQGKLVAQQGPTIQVTQELTPVSVTEKSPNLFVFDLGQNMVGWARLKVQGPAGTKIILRFAEVLQPDGNIYTDNYRSARATDTYILKGEGVEVWEPHFTYRGFRYVELSGYPGKPAKDAITGVVFHSAPEVTGHFACSNELINRIQHNITWGQRGNMHSVPTDCPQRDERLGWTGDAQIFAPTASFNMNMAGFFTKWMRDIIDCQDADGAVHDVNPTIAVAGPASPAWGDAVVIIPWVVYQNYGDKRIIEENYEGMAKWVAYMQSKSKDYLYEREGYGDWVAVVPSPKKPIGAAYFYYSTALLAKMAAVIGQNDDARKYEELAGKIAEAFNKKYLDQETYQYEGATQSANLLPLAFGITPQELRDKVAANVASDVRARETHLSTGFLGTAYLCPVLSANGFHDLAYALAGQKTYPSWGYMAEKDATTIWELWNSDTEGPGMNSRNHFALGSVGRWFYEWLGGLRVDPQAPGFKRTIIAPKPVGDLSWAEVSLQSLYGPIHSKWTIKDNGLTLTVTIPANTSAEVHVPTLGKENPSISERGMKLLEAGKATNASADIQFMRMEKDAVVFKVGAGSYSFVLQ